MVLNKNNNKKKNPDPPTYETSLKMIMYLPESYNHA
jgi:hypothetical protein